jgi:hypothetical protein
MPLGRFAPLSHFSTVDSLVFKYRANTGWLTFWLVRIFRTFAGVSLVGFTRQLSSKLPKNSSFLNSSTPHILNKTKRADT